MDRERAGQLVEAGMWLQLTGDLEGARRLFEQALVLDPQNARARELMGAYGTPAPRPQGGPLPHPAPAQAPVPGPQQKPPAATATQFPTQPPTFRPLPPGAPPSAVTPPMGQALPRGPQTPQQAPRPATSAPQKSPSPSLRDTDWGALSDSIDVTVEEPVSTARPPAANVPAPPPAHRPAPSASAGTPFAAPRPPSYPFAPPAAPAEERSPPAPERASSAPSGWDSNSEPGVHISQVTPGLGDAMDLVAERDPTPPPAAAPADAGVRSEVHALMRGARDLLELDDHSGAMELILKAQALAPNDPEVQALRERSEGVLLAMYESRIGPMSACPRVVLKDDEIIWLNFDHRAGFVLAQIDGTVRFDDLFEVCGMSRIDTARILAQLVDEGVISAE